MMEVYLKKTNKQNKTKKKPAVIYSALRTGTTPKR